MTAERLDKPREIVELESVFTDVRDLSALATGAGRHALADRLNTIAERLEWSIMAVQYGAGIADLVLPGLCDFRAA